MNAMCTHAVSLARIFVILFTVLLVAGCAGTNTFHQVARAGDTVAIPVGWEENLSRDNISVWVRPQGGVWTEYMSNDPRIRAVVNFYPDPLSSLVVSNRTGQNITRDALLYGDIISTNFNSNNRDWFQTVVFFDLPEPMALGVADIDVEQAGTGNFVSSTLEIVAGTGVKHAFGTEALGPMVRKQLASLERASHFTITLSGTTVPHAVQLDFTHDPDVDNGGAGRAYVVEPSSGLKNISWKDDGVNLRVVIMPAAGNTLTSFNDFRFYVAGGITNLTPVSIQAFNINGAEVTGVSPIVTPHNIIITTSN